MDQKTWLWRKRSAEKTIVTNGGGEDNAQTAQPDRATELENSLKDLNEKLASAIDECSTKDRLLQSYEKSSEDAKEDKLKAEAEIQRLSNELEEAAAKYTNADEKLIELNSALKDSMEQLNLLRSEQERTVQEAVRKANKELERSCKKLEENLSESNKGLATLTVENSYLTKALVAKEKLMEGMKEKSHRKEAEFEALMSRLDTVEKENAFLRYEFRALEKELDVRSEEIERCRGNLEAVRKQKVEAGKKVKKLEAECARLRDLNRKRLSGPHYEMTSRRKGGNKGEFLLVRDMEKECAVLRECLGKKEEEISYLRMLTEKLGSIRSNNSSARRDEAISSSCSRDYDAIISKSIEASEMSLMDDFLRMERLAIVAVDDPPSKTAKDLVPFRHDDSEEYFEQESKHAWLEDVRKLILKQHEVSKTSLEQLLEDITKDLNSVINHESFNLLPISGYIAWKSPGSSPRSGLTENPNDELGPSDLIKSSLLKVAELVDKLGKSPKETEHKAYAFAWKISDLRTKLQEFVSSCKNLSGGKVKLEKVIEDLTLILAWIVNSSTYYEDNHNTVRDLFAKNLGEKSGPGTALGLESVQKLMLEMEKMHSMARAQIESLRDELNSMKESKNQSERSQTEGLEAMMEEMRQTYEDQIEELKVVNTEMDTQLTVTKCKLHEAVRKLSTVEAELDNKSHCCEELKGTCVDLQLQIESQRFSNQNTENDRNGGDQEDLLQTGKKITKASEKLAECEEAMFKLGNHLKSLASAKELSVVERVLNITDGNNTKRLLNPRPSLRDRMLSEDHNDVTDPNTYAKSRALIVVGKKQSGGFGFLKKLIFRRKKNNFKKSSLW